MKFTFDIHTKLLGVISIAGLIMLGFYHYHTKVIYSWPHAEILDIKSTAMLSFCMLVPFLFILLVDRKEPEAQNENHKEMNSFRQFLNSPKGIKIFVFGIMYLLPIMIICLLINEAVKG